MKCSARLLLAGLLASSIAACATPASQPGVEDRERALMNPLKAKYPSVIQGFDFHGPAVDVSIDPNELLSMDEDVEDALKAAALARWRSAWSATHAKQHATVVVRLIDYRGTPYYNASAKV